MNTTRKVRQYQTSHWFIFSIILSATIVMDYLHQSQLRTLSINKLVEFISKYGQFKNEHIFSDLFASYGIEGIICILLLLVYNFGNIFKFIILLTSIQVSFLFISIFQLIYRSRKPIFDHQTIPLYSSHVSFGHPSLRIFLSSVFFLTLHRITFRSSRFEGRAAIKLLGFIFSLFVIFIISAFTWITGLNSLDQIIFGGLLGYCVYFFYFFVLNINSNSPKQLHKLVVFPIYYYFIVLMGICLGYFLLFFILNDYEESNEQLNNLQQQERCKGIVINRYFSLDNGSLFLFILSLTNIGTILGLKAEYLFLFESNYINWLQYNFEKDEEKNDDDSLCSKLCINKDIQWNHTGLCISIIRLVFICLFLAGSAVLFQYLQFPIDNISIFLGKVFIIANSICFGFCFFYKLILKWFKLTNITLFTILRESI